MFLAAWTFLAPAAALHAAPLTVTTGNVQAAPGKEVVVPITFKGVKDYKGVSCMSIRLNYDPAMLTFKSLDKGAALPNALFDKSIDEKADPGKIGLGFVCGSKTPDSKDMASVGDDGVVLNLTFVVSDKAKSGQKSPLKLDNYRILDSQEPPMELPVQTTDGEFTVQSAGFPDIPLWWIIIGAAAFFLLLLLIILATRRRREPQPPPYYPQQGIPTATPTVVPTFQPVNATFTHRCTKCGGTFELPRSVLGHPFKCGACGTTQTGTQMT